MNVPSVITFSVGWPSATHPFRDANTAFPPGAEGNIPLPPNVDRVLYLGFVREPKPAPVHHKASRVLLKACGAVLPLCNSFRKLSRGCVRACCPCRTSNIPYGGLRRANAPVSGGEPRQFSANGPDRSSATRRLQCCRIVVMVDEESRPAQPARSRTSRPSP